jgi:hypothetical protein
VALLGTNDEGQRVGDSGYIDWHRLHTHLRDTGTGSTFVYAFWLADYDRNARDYGLMLIKPGGAHPDPFIYGTGADEVLFSVARDGWSISPNLTGFYDTHLTSRPALGAICLGTSTHLYAQGEDYWWCAYPDLTRTGRKLVKQLSELYGRTPLLLTYLSLHPIDPAVPGATGDSATVAEAPGHPPV